MNVDIVYLKKYVKKLLITLAALVCLCVLFVLSFICYMLTPPSPSACSISPDGKIRVYLVWSAFLANEAMDGYWVYSKSNNFLGSKNEMGYAAYTSLEMGAQCHWSPDSRYFSIWQGKIPKFYYDFQRKSNYNLDFLAYTIKPPESYGFKNSTDWIDFLLQNNFSSDRFFLSAARDGNVDVVKYLISKNVLINNKEISYYPPLVSAVYGGHEEIVQILVENGADVNISNKYGVNACRVAASKGYDAIMKILLENHANIEFKGQDGNTAIMIASKNGHASIVKNLLDHGTKINVKNKDGKTALDLANENHHEEIVRLFMEYSEREKG